MPLLREEAEKLSNDTLESGVIDEIIDRDDLFAVLPFVQVNSKAYLYNREDTLAAADWIDPNEEIQESASTFTEVVAKLRILAGDVDIDKFLDSTMGDTNSQMAIQVAKKAKGVARQFHQTLATGDTATTPKSFDGIAKLVTAEQTISMGPDGGALTLAKLDELVDLIPLGPDVLVMRRGTIRAFRSLLRATYGTDAVMQQLENFGRPMLTHNGIPIIMNEFLAANEAQGAATQTCSVYAVRLNEADGLHGLYGGSSAGIVVENIGTVQNKDATRIRLKWYCGLALKSTRSLARLKGVTNI
ncbi:major capsid protein [Acinetobacter tibetensis]|uniref:major capsid protein n=1 Tax=Acinetobacter tibetensis TaxID=2943497 RepID=UPI003A4E309A